MKESILDNLETFVGVLAVLFIFIVMPVIYYQKITIPEARKLSSMKYGDCVENDIGRKAKLLDIVDNVIQNSYKVQWQDTNEIETKGIGFFKKC